MATHPLWQPYASTANAQRQSVRVAHRQDPPGPLHTVDGGWADQYRRVRQLVEHAIEDQVLDVCHVGSTAVPGLLAKPVLDIDLTVPDAREESDYLPRLEAVGFRLIFRDDLGGDVHRQITLSSPNTNLHVWSPGAVEPQRHELFVRWLRVHEEDRERYTTAKRLAASGDACRRYNDAKSSVVYDIYERAFLADPSYSHDPHPRTSHSQGTGLRLHLPPV